MVKTIAFCTFLSWFLFYGISCCGQSAASEFLTLKRHVEKAPSDVQEVKAIANYLLGPTNTDREKVWVLYAWIQQNISYDHQAYNNGNRRINKNNGDILKRKKAICFGYASLFKEMCEVAGVPCIRVSGYSKGTLTSAPEKEEPDHAWNVVNVDNEWFPIDITWATVEKDYFLTPPEVFILNHLPADPMWQLLNCPINYEQFRLPPNQISTLVDTSSICFDYRDSIEQHQALPKPDRILKASRNAYRFYPSIENRGELGHSLVDYAGRISNRIERLDQEKDLEEVLQLQQRMIEVLKEAVLLVNFYNWQRELFVEVLLNQSVVLYNQTTALQDRSAIEKKLAKAMSLLMMAGEQIENLEPGPYKEQVLQQHQTFFKAVKGEIR